MEPRWPRQRLPVLEMFKVVHLWMLASPYTMAASGTYYLMASETNGGDTWYDDNTSVTTTAVANDSYSIYSGSPNSGILLNALGHTFVPPTFQYAGSCQSVGKVGRLIGFGQ